MSTKIIQIIAAPKPLFAVFKIDSAENGGLVLDECPVLALVEEEGNRCVIGLTLGEYGYSNPTSTENFKCYASSKENALELLGNTASEDPTPSV